MAEVWDFSREEGWMTPCFQDLSILSWELVEVVRFFHSLRRDCVMGQEDKLVERD